MNKNLIDSKLQEYLFLRSEIELSLKAQDSTINTCLTFVTAVLTIAISQKNTYIPILVYPAIFLFLHRFIRHREGLANMSGYMIIFLEPYIDIHWETYNAIQYKRSRTGYTRKGAWHAWRHIIWVGMAVSSLICSFLIDTTTSEKITRQQSNYMVLFYAICILMTIVIYQISTRLVLFNQNRTNAIKKWNDFKHFLNTSPYVSQNMIDFILDTNSNPNRNKHFC